MKTSVLRSSLLVLSGAALLVGCEWSGTSDSGSWSSSYDNMNFSGTYRSSIVATSSESVSTVDESGTTKTTKYTDTVKRSGLVGVKSFTGSFSNVGVGTLDLSSVSIQFSGDCTEGFTSDSAGILTGTAGGSGTCNGTGWKLETAAKVSGSVTITVNYKVTTSGSEAASTIANTTTTASEVTAITVSQNGQNVVMRFNNGIQMDGRFTAVNQTGSVSGADGVDMFNAQFEVASGNASKFVGTLTYDKVSGYRTLDGSWTWGKNTYDVHGTGPAYR